MKNSILALTFELSCNSWSRSDVGVLRALICAITARSNSCLVSWWQLFLVVKISSFNSAVEQSVPFGPCWHLHESEKNWSTFCISFSSLKLVFISTELLLMSWSSLSEYCFAIMTHQQYNLFLKTVPQTQTGSIVWRSSGDVKLSVHSLSHGLIWWSLGRSWWMMASSW